MTTITDKLEGLLPENGPQTDDERVIAEAVRELRRQQRAYGHVCDWAERAEDALNNAEASLGKVKRKLIETALCAFATGCIASAIYVVLV